MTLKELIGKAKTLTISNQSAQEVSLQQATCVSVPPKLIGEITANNLWDKTKFGPLTTAAIEMSKTRAGASGHWVNVHIDSLANLWSVRHGTEWVDVYKEIVEKGSAEEEMLRELWFAGRMERMYRPDLGREVWRVIPKGGK